MIGCPVTVALHLYHSSYQSNGIEDLISTTGDGFDISASDIWQRLVKEMTRYRLIGEFVFASERQLVILRQKRAGQILCQTPVG